MDNATKPTAPGLPADLRGDRLIRPAQLADLLGVSRTTVYKLAKAGRIPPPRRISHRVSGWRASEVMGMVYGAEQHQAA